MLKVERYGTRYCVRYDDTKSVSSDPLCLFENLYTATLFARHLQGKRLSEMDTIAVRNAVEAYDREWKEKNIRKKVSRGN